MAGIPQTLSDDGSNKFARAAETSKRSASSDEEDESSPPLRKVKLDSNAAPGGPVPIQELKYGTKLYYCRHCDMFALLKQKLAAHKREVHNKKPKKKTGTTTRRTRGRNSTIINQGAGSESGQGASSSGDVDNSEDSMDYDLTDDSNFHDPADDDYDEEEGPIPHDELYGPVF